MTTAARTTDNGNGRAVYGRLIEILSVCMLGIMLWAGLWPFCAPRNRVRWLGNKNGLQFASNSSVLSNRAFHANSASANTWESIEIGLIPSSSSSSGTILAFGESDHPGLGFSVLQYKNMLFARQYYVNENGTLGAKWLPVGNEVSEGAPLFLSITMGDVGTSIYVNGTLSRALAWSGESTNNLTGRLVVGDGVEGHSCWPGQILELAMYASQLTPSQVAEHYASWTKSQSPVIRENEAPMALFTFDERQGNVLHNRIDSTNNLVIPKRYFALHPPFLTSVKRDYRPGWDYWHDIAVNIVGFIPCGVLVTVLLSEVRVVKYPALTAILFGLLISLLIEVMQAFLPTRSSGVTDLIANTLGTGIGVAIYHWRPAQSLLGRLRQWFGINLAPVAAGQRCGLEEASAMAGVRRGLTI